MSRRRRHRIAGLGRPFLVTVSISAPAAACDSAAPQADPGANGDELFDGGLPREEPIVARRSAPPVECPERAPEPDTPCERPQLACEYGDCEADGSAIDAECSAEGRWEVEESFCNPPIPCPESTPQVGASCDSSMYFAPCDYVGCNRSGIEIYACERGTWTITDGGTCPRSPDDDGGV